MSALGVALDATVPQSALAGGMIEQTGLNEVRGTASTRASRAATRLLFARLLFAVYRTRLTESLAVDFVLIHNMSTD